jgi:hypothetical protein
MSKYTTEFREKERRERQRERERRTIMVDSKKTKRACWLLLLLFPDRETRRSIAMAVAYKQKKEKAQRSEACLLDLCSSRKGEDRATAHLGTESEREGTPLLRAPQAAAASIFSPHGHSELLPRLPPVGKKELFGGLRARFEGIGG